MDFLTLLCLAVILAAGGVYGWQRRGVVRFVKRRVVVHTKVGVSIQGILIASHGDCVELRQPEELAQKATLEGEAVILKSNIDFIQVLGADR